MRTLSEIINAAKANEETTHEECLYALLAVEALSTFDTESLRRSGSAEMEGKSVYAWSKYEESFNRWKAALAKSPMEWLGWNNDPKNPEVQQRRKIALKILDRFLPKEEAAKP